MAPEKETEEAFRRRIEGLRELKVSVCLISMVADNPGEWILDERGRRFDHDFKFPGI